MPYLVQSDQQVPGEPTWYASTCAECDAGCGLHVKTREGRPIKLEGNPDHPVNAGRLCSRGQAGLQALYNPDRLKGPMARNAKGEFDAITWDDAIARLSSRLTAAQGKFAVINGYGPSTFTALLGDLTAALGGSVVAYQPFDREPERLANGRTWGLSELPSYDFAAADTSCRSAPTSSTPGDRWWNSSAALPTRTASTTAPCPDWSTSGRGCRSPARTPMTG